MKMVMAVIKPHKMDAVREALSELAVNGMTATEVKGLWPPARPYGNLPWRRITR